MQKTNTKLWVRFVPLILVLTLVIAACSNGDDDGGGDDGPTSNTQPTVTITPTTFAGALPEEGTDDGEDTGGGDTGGEDTGGSVGAQQTGPNVSTFTAVGSDADGDTLEYSWAANDPSVQLSATSGEAITATFTAEGDYTVTVTVDDQSDEANATNSAAANASIAGPGEEPEEPEDPDTGGDGSGGETPEEPGATPTLTSFGVSDSEDGEFLNDGPSGINAEGDDGVLTISPGDTFYVQVGASAADGIDSITLQLRNVDTEEMPNGENNVTPLVQDTEVEGFTLGAPDCTVPTDETTVTCVYPVVTSAAADESNLTSGEFAYVFRAQVNTVEIGGFGNRGYVNTN